MKINIRRFIKCIAIPLLVGGLAGILTQNSMETFKGLNQPPFSPPGWLFPVVWTILYFLMGVASYLVLESRQSSEMIQKAMNFYFYQLVVNFLWPIFFFRFEWYLFSFFWLLLLWILVLITFRLFYEISKVAGYLLIPYILWLTFAAYLNFGIWYLNR